MPYNTEDQIVRTLSLNTRMKLIGVLILLFAVFKSQAQESPLLNNGNLYYPNADDYAHNQLHGLAIKELEVLKFNDTNVSKEASSSFAIAETRSIDLMLESIARQGHDPLLRNNTLFIIANQYFKKQDFESAQVYYKKINQDDFSGFDRQEIAFKSAYTYLVDRNFKAAQEKFEIATQLNGDYKKDAIYYTGICQFYEGEKEAAIASFKQVDSQKKYKEIVPFYLAQIYFEDKEYAKVIDYAHGKLKSSNTANKNQINRILGMSYLAMKDYNQALPYLEAYAEDTPKLTENEFYQIATINYRLGKLDKAEEYFKELSHQNSPIGQMSNYLLGSIYLDKSQKKDAQSVFKLAARTDHYKDIKEESDFLYYKLSADLSEERIAINGLSQTAKESPYFRESQDILADVLQNTDDYAAAATTIENLPYKGDKLQNTYKLISFENGKKLLADKQTNQAIASFEKSLNTPGNNQISSETHFYLGHAYDSQNKTELSEKHLNDYIESGHREHAFEASYLVAYNKLDQKDYKNSLTHLETAIRKYDVNKDDKVLLDDALVRLADLELMNNNYDDAIEYYDLAIKNDATESDYILYQKSLIYGVNNNHLDKLTNLEKLISIYPNSKYRDDAYFQIGESLITLKKHNEAVKIYEHIIIEYGDKSPYTPTAHMRQGLLSYNGGDMHGALDAYKQGYKKSKNKEEKRQALIAIEEIYVSELNDPEKYFAFTESEGGIQIADITKDSITYDIALDAYKQGQYEKAIRLFDKYKSRYASGYYINDAVYNSAESFVLLKKYDKALIEYERLLTDNSNPYYDNALKNSALISYNHKQDFIKSFKYYDTLFESSNKQSLEYAEAALYSAFISKNNSGIEKYGLATTAHVDASKDSKSTAYFYLAKLYQSQDRTDEAFASYTEVSKLSTNNQAAESSYMCSVILLEQEKYDEAEAQAFSTTQTGASYSFWVAKSLIVIGKVYTHKKDYINASAAYESIIENFKENKTVTQEAQDLLDALQIEIENNSRIKEEAHVERPQSLDFISSETPR